MPMVIGIARQPWLAISRAGRIRLVRPARGKSPSPRVHTRCGVFGCLWQTLCGGVSYNRKFGGWPVYQLLGVGVGHRLESGYLRSLLQSLHCRRRRFRRRDLANLQAFGSQIPAFAVRYTVQAVVPMAALRRLALRAGDAIVGRARIAACFVDEADATEKTSEDC